MRLSFLVNELSRKFDKLTQWVESLDSHNHYKTQCAQFALAVLWSSKELFSHNIFPKFVKVSSCDWNNITFYRVHNDHHWHRFYYPPITTSYVNNCQNFRVPRLNCQTIYKCSPAISQSQECTNVSQITQYDQWSFLQILLQQRNKGTLCENHRH